MDIIIVVLLVFLGINILGIVALVVLSKLKKRKMESFEKDFKVDKKKKLDVKPSKKLNFKPKHYFVVGIYLIVFLIIAYLVIGNLAPNSIPGSSGEYVISADSNLLSDSLSSFYISPSNVLGEKVEVNGETLRPIVSQQTFNLVFKPKTIVPGDSKGTLELNFIEGVSGGSEVYLNDNLIIPNTDNYELVASFSDKDVYIKKSILSNYNKNSLASGNSAGDFIYRNFPGATIYSQIAFNQSTPDLTDYKQETTKIPTTFRGDLKLVVYADSYLEIDFTKQDLNGYLGDDEYQVLVQDINGKVYYNETYEDDGERKNTNKLGDEEDFNIKLSNLPRGVYFITFTKDKNNDGADSTIKNIEINSNKVVIVGTILPITKFDFYTKTSVGKTLGFNYWWSDKNQTIQISGDENKNIKLDKEWLSKTCTQNFTKPGEYYIKTNIGYLWVYADYLSVSKETWFDVPVKSNSQKFTSQDVIISDKKSLEVSEGKYTYKTIVSIDELKALKIKVLDPNKIYFKEVKYTI